MTEVIRVLFQTLYSVIYEDRLQHEEVAVWELHTLPGNIECGWELE